MGCVRPRRTVPGCDTAGGEGSTRTLPSSSLKQRPKAHRIDVLCGCQLRLGIKFIVAHSRHFRRGMHPPRPAEQEISSDPDNIPPRSRLFIVVPKQAEPQQINVSGVPVLSMGMLHSVERRAQLRMSPLRDAAFRTPSLPMMAWSTARPTWLHPRAWSSASSPRRRTLCARWRT